MINLARLSAVTERVRIGTAVLLLPLYSPAIIAKQTADLDNATAGRVTLGVGIGGEYPQEFRACQVPMAERGRRMDEAIPLLRKLWSAEQISHDGPFYPMQDVRVHPAPLQAEGPPVVIAGRKEPAMRRAARLGDGWMPYLYSPRRYAESVARIREIASEAGRSLDSFEWFAFVFVNAEDKSTELVDKLQAFVDAGARHLVLSPAAGGGDPREVQRRLLAEVVPTLRERARTTGG